MYDSVSETESTERHRFFFNFLKLDTRKTRKMSLFKVCTFWTAQCSDYQSSYDAQLLRCCRFGSDKSEKDYIVVGSHSGYLSVFKPNAIGDPEESFTGFAPTDQLLEVKLSNPIIQLSSGKFLV